MKTWFSPNILENAGYQTCCDTGIKIISQKKKKGNFFSSKMEDWALVHFKRSNSSKQPNPRKKMQTDTELYLFAVSCVSLFCDFSGKFPQKKKPSHCNWEHVGLLRTVYFPGHCNKLLRQKKQRSMCKCLQRTHKAEIYICETKAQRVKLNYSGGGDPAPTFSGELV